MSNWQQQLYDETMKKRGQSAAPIQPTSKPKRKMSHLEDDEQLLVIRWARMYEYKYPALCWLLHIPNGGKRDAREAARLKAQGVVAGVADLFLPYPSGNYHGLWIEMKSADGKLSDSQSEFLMVMVSRGYRAEVAFSSSAAIEIIKSYLEIDAK